MATSNLIVLIFESFGTHSVAPLIVLVNPTQYIIIETETWGNLSWYAWEWWFSDTNLSLEYIQQRHSYGVESYGRALESLNRFITEYNPDWTGRSLNERFSLCERELTQHRSELLRAGSSTIRRIVTSDTLREVYSNNPSIFMR